jgi:hypothetical protein
LVTALPKQKEQPLHFARVVLFASACSAVTVGVKTSIDRAGVLAVAQGGRIVTRARQVGQAFGEVGKEGGDESQVEVNGPGAVKFCVVSGVHVCYSLSFFEQVMFLFYVHYTGWGAAKHHPPRMEK